MILDILKKFNIDETKGELLPGGQGTSYKYGEYVVKPVDNEEYYSFVMNLFDSLNPVDYRISRPIKSVNDKYVENGYAVTKYEVGFDFDDLRVKLEVSNLLHSDLKKLKIEKLPISSDPWTKANNCLWKNGTTDELGEEKELCDSLLRQLPLVEEEYQLIHGDLGGNIMNGDSPLVIDFSPAIAPKKYADAIIVCDAIAWECKSLDEIVLLDLSVYKPFILYAIVFRVLAVAFNEDCDYKRFLDEWNAYKNIWKYVIELQ